MRRLAVRLALPAALAASTAACTLTTDVSTLDPYQDLESFCPVLFDKVIDQFESCTPMAPAYRDRFYAGALQSCTLLVASEQAGRLGFDAGAAHTCIEQMAAPSCGDFGPACDAVAVPLVDPGGACSLDADCKAPADGCFNPDLACPGTCMSRGGAGDPCGDLYPSCNPAFTCDTTTGSPACTPLPGLGDPCGGLPCRPGLTCSAGACVQQGGLGATCTSDTQCDSRLDLFCDAGQCAVSPTVGGGLGASCAFPRFCDEAFYCTFEASSLLCAPRRGLGATCTFGSQCQPPASCLPTLESGGTVSTCTVPPQEGGTCRVGDDGCAVGLFCAGSAAGASGTCRPWPGVGGTCGPVNGERVGCLEGWCDEPLTGAPGTCRATRALGQACTSDEQCDDGAFLSDVRCVVGTSGGVCAQVACR